jgi:hypothetical protein
VDDTTASDLIEKGWGSKVVAKPAKKAAKPRKKK